jgi:hypothetical protein
MFKKVAKSTKQDVVLCNISDRGLDDGVYIIVRKPAKSFFYICFSPNARRSKRLPGANPVG